MKVVPFRGARGADRLELVRLLIGEVASDGRLLHLADQLCRELPVHGIGKPVMLLDFFAERTQAFDVPALVAALIPLDHGGRFPQKSLVHIGIHFLS